MFLVFKDAAWETDGNRRLLILSFLIRNLLGAGTGGLLPRVPRAGLGWDRLDLDLSISFLFFLKKLLKSIVKLLENSPLEGKMVSSSVAPDGQLLFSSLEDSPLELRLVSEWLVVTLLSGEMEC